MSKKVYELASELGVGAIELVEKLKAMGMNVRNHMASLTDEEVAKAQATFNPPQKAQAAVKKTVVKKVVRKASSPEPEPTAANVAAEVEVKAEEPKPIEEIKVLADKLDEESTPGSSAQEVTTTDEDGKSKTVMVKRKTKLQKEEERREAEVAHAQAQAHALAQAQAQANSDAEVSSTSARSSTNLAGQKKEYFQEKMHTFTPIFVPEEKKKTDTPTAKPAFPRINADTGLAEEDDDDSELGKSKKRMSDLAAMVTKKAATKSKDITMLRAEEEMKFASALVGRAIYTPPKKKKVYVGPKQETRITEIKAENRVITIHGSVKLEDLAEKLSVKFETFANKMLHINLLVKPEDQVGLILANEMAKLFNYVVVDVAFYEEKLLQKEKNEDKSKFPIRNPIVTIMGHVDHGKTSLLDYIRKAKVASGEAGGITQHIGAYSVKVKDSTLTFLDTPGHAAFAAMRQRGANVTDIVVLVVAADDGVMPQTVESIKFCQNAGVPIIVAMNKMDKPHVNPDEVKRGLMEFSLTPEDWGGETVYVGVSALTGLGVDQLLESIQLQAEIMELRENNKGPAEGVVIESKIELGRGPVATILIQKGTLEKGDAIVVGETTGRARSLMDFTGKMLTEAGPSTPVQILGLEEVPNPGDILNVVKNEREAKKIVENRINDRKSLAGAEVKKVSLEDFFATAQSATDEKKVLKLVVRADVQGSYEAIKTAIEKIGNNEVSVEVLGGGVGAITDNDVLLAASAKGYIVGFNMRPATTARRLAEEKGVDIKTYSIIYELMNDITLALEGMLTPEKIEKYLGRAQVRETFTVPKVGVIAGTSVIDGKIERGCNIRLLRDGKIIYDGKLSSLKRFKDDVKEVRNGYECGLSLENFNDVKIEDLVEAYTMEEKKRSLEASAIQ